MEGERAPTIWPAGSGDPRVVIHRDRRSARAWRWGQRALRQTRELAQHAAANLAPLAHYTLAGVAIAGLTFLPEPPVHTERAFINFIVYAIIMIVAIIISVALAPKPPQPKPAAIADFNVPTAEEGKPMCKVFGEYIVKDPNVLWYGDLTTSPIKKKGGKK